MESVLRESKTNADGKNTKRRKQDIKLKENFSPKSSEKVLLSKITDGALLNLIFNSSDNSDSDSSCSEEWLVSKSPKKKPLMELKSPKPNKCITPGSQKYVTPVKLKRRTNLKNDCGDVSNSPGCRTLIDTKSSDEEVSDLIEEQLKKINLGKSSAQKILNGSHQNEHISKTPLRSARRSINYCEISPDKMEKESAREVNVRSSPRLSTRSTRLSQLSPAIKSHESPKKVIRSSSASVNKSDSPIKVEEINSPKRGARSKCKTILDDVDDFSSIDSSDRNVQKNSPRTRLNSPKLLSSSPNNMISSRLDGRSPRTPTTSLRRQVLDSLTPVSARKKLLMDENADKISSSKRCPRSPKIAKDVDPLTPSKRTPRKQTPSKKITSDGEVSSPAFHHSIRKVGQGFLTPVLSERVTKMGKLSSLDSVRIKLHVSTIPTSLPCRQSEFENIHCFLERKITDGLSGCMYISGVPGTGKTATVLAVVKSLQESAASGEIPSFDFVEINGLRLTEPRQAYVRIWQILSGNKVSSDSAMRELEKKFSTFPKRSTVLLVDELDYLCNRRQDVVYNILDWPSKHRSKLVVVTIANTMDLPERTLKGKVTSRMGLTRLVFQPYTFKQLQEIVMDRLTGCKYFHVDAIQLISRKVAAVSGDARRVLDICRRSMETLKSEDEVVTVNHVEEVLAEIFSSSRVKAIRCCSYMEQMVLRSIRDETHRTGIEETCVRDVYSHLSSLCVLEGSWVPNVSEVLKICCALASCGLIVAEKGRNDINTKLTLNVSSDDIHYAIEIDDTKKSDISKLMAD